SSVLPAAMLVLPAAAARARIVASDFRSVADRLGLLRRGHRFADHFTPLGRRRVARRLVSAEGAGGLVHRLLRHAAQELLERHQARRAAEDVVANLRLDVDHQFIKHLERLGFVFDERVALAILPQANAVPQTVHAVEMLLPEAVNRAENSVTFDGFELLRIFKADFQLVSLAHALRDELADSELRGTQVGEHRAAHRFLLTAPGRLDDFAL